MILERVGTSSARALETPVAVLLVGSLDSRAENDRRTWGCLRGPSPAVPSRRA
ncbi:Superoxide dismutase [Zea mays]|uniref:Superoxide dismutase n=1 Tax=Zea mays TaxID=4577 RepID=A0A1D6PAC0_MAIZE|nr:Superoxide dismutase [Zea mays]